MVSVGNGLGTSRLRTLAATVAACAVCGGIGITSIQAMPRYDGLWSVSIVTEKGDCDRGYRYPIRITNGRLANAGEAGFTIGGKVGPSGFVSVVVSHGNASAKGVGRLAGGEGSGSWQSASCSGSWTAERRSS
ncbi:MAG: hypothetical protein WBF58_09690 [Xanthobacteraceae bacterium]